jgi:hypothetical protein
VAPAGSGGADTTLGVPWGNELSHGHASDVVLTPVPPAPVPPAPVPLELVEPVEDEEEDDDEDDDEDDEELEDEEDEEPEEDRGAEATAVFPRSAEAASPIHCH